MDKAQQIDNLFLFLNNLESAAHLWNRSISQQIKRGTHDLGKKKHAALRYAINGGAWHEGGLDDEDWEELASSYSHTVSGYDVSGEQFKRLAHDALEELSEAFQTSRSRAKILVWMSLNHSELAFPGI